ncbi:hypothetical protein OH77DRAFT_836082 [Trametes cingulata]|nr:hypothetical protein OH77DRAFT_836082 [Trametes cingulata]
MTGELFLLRIIATGCLHMVGHGVGTARSRCAQGLGVGRHLYGQDTIPSEREVTPDVRTRRQGVSGEPLEMLCPYEQHSIPAMTTS